MAFKRIFLVLLLSAIALARPDGPGSPNRADKPEGKKGPGGAPEGPHFSRPLPPFIANLSMEAKIEFDSVFKNKSLTLAQIDAQDALLVEKYGVAAVYKEFKANVTAYLAEVKKNQTKVISNLSSVAEKIDAILSNKDQTRKAQHEALIALRKEFPIEFDVLRFISSPKRDPKGPGGLRRPKGPKGPKGPGGPHGKPPGGPKKVSEEKEASGSAQASSEDK